MLLVFAVSLTFFLASTCRATFGFGDSLMAMPILLLLLEPTVAVAIMGGVGLVMGVGILITAWREVRLRSVLPLLLGAVIVAPVGAYTLTVLRVVTVQRVLGVIVVAYCIFALRVRDLPPLRGRVWAFFFGALSGWLGGAYSLAGPPVIVYGTLRRWSAAKFRACLQAFFLPLGVVVTSSHVAAGFWNGEVVKLTAAAVPALAVGVLLGTKLSRSIDTARFQKLVYLVLMVLGGVLFATA